VHPAVLGGHHAGFLETAAVLAEAFVLELLVGLVGAGDVAFAGVAVHVGEGLARVEQVVVVVERVLGAHQTVLLQVVFVHTFVLIQQTFVHQTVPMFITCTCGFFNVWQFCVFGFSIYWTFILVILFVLFVRFNIVNFFQEKVALVGVFLLLLLNFIFEIYNFILQKLAIFGLLTGVTGSFVLVVEVILKNVVVPQLLDTHV